MKEFFANPIIKPFAYMAVIPSIPIAPKVDLYSVVWLLVYLFIADFISGLLGSYFSWKNNPERGVSFFGCDKGFSSDKFKKCFLKGIVYGGFPIIILKFQQIFLLKNITFSSLTDSQIDVTTMFLLVFCANEFFSIFWENLPKCGLNIPKGIKNLIVGVKDVTNDEKE